MLTRQGGAPGGPELDHGDVLAAPAGEIDRVSLHPFRDFEARRRHSEFGREARRGRADGGERDRQGREQRLHGGDSRQAGSQSQIRASRRISGRCFPNLPERGHQSASGRPRGGTAGQTSGPGSRSRRSGVNAAPRPASFTDNIGMHGSAGGGSLAGGQLAAEEDVGGGLFPRGEPEIRQGVGGQGQLIDEKLASPESLGRRAGELSGLIHLVERHDLGELFLDQGAGPAEGRVGMGSRGDGAEGPGGTGAGEEVGGGDADAAEVAAVDPGVEGAVGGEAFGVGADPTVVMAGWCGGVAWRRRPGGRGFP
jgi:hypothetical protein